MGKVKKKKFISIKRTFLWYLPLCVLVAYLGAYGIGWIANELQYWYEMMYSDVNYQTMLEDSYAKLDELHDEWGGFDKIPEGTPGILIGDEAQNVETYMRIEFSRTTNGITFYDVRNVGKLFSDNPWHQFVYGVISYGQGILMIGWVLLCVFATGVVFYKRELEMPISVLMDASEKISENCLDFELKPVKQNELGQLCRSFEDMRQALYENNRELWHTLEERKRLNAAFSHDIRTPLAVLKGYQEMMQNYVPEDKFSKEQLMEMIDTMGSQIERLENYTQKMSAVQKLEDIVPEYSKISLKELCVQCRETGKLLADNLEFDMQTSSDTELYIDKELFLEVFENLVSNGARFAKSRIKATLGYEEEMLVLAVEDDGPGFSEEALHRGTDPFYGSEKDGRIHFGLGLYLCKTICEKHGGELVLENRTLENVVCGGFVTAKFGRKETNSKM